MPEALPLWRNPDSLTCISVKGRQDHEKPKKIYNLFKGTLWLGRADLADQIAPNELELMEENLNKNLWELSGDKTSIKST